MAILLNVESHDDGIKLESFTVKHFKYLSKSHFYKLVRTGQIRVNGGRTRAPNKLHTGDEIRFPPFIYEYKNDGVIHENISDAGERLEKKKPSASWEKNLREVKDSIIFEDENIFAINKPSGLASQGGSKTRVSLDELMNMVDNSTGDIRKVRLVHRLDKDTSGVMIFAKNLVTARSLTADFKEKNIHKTYLALCYGKFKDKSGVIKSDIIDDDKSLPATTHYRVLGDCKGMVSLVELQPETGRKHQLRIHLSEIGHAVIGDTKHCTRKQLKELNIALKSALEDDKLQILEGSYLHAFKIEWQDSVDGNKSICAKLSDRFLVLVEKLFPKNIFDKYV